MFIIQLHRPTGAFKTASILKKYVAEHSLPVFDIEVGTSMDGHQCVGFSCDTKKEAFDVAQRLMGAGFGIPKVYGMK